MPILETPPDLVGTKALLPVDGSDEAKGIVEAIVAVTGNVDSGGDVIIPGTTSVDRWPKVLQQHDTKVLVGKFLAMEELLPGDARLPTDLLVKGYGALWGRLQFDLEDPDGAKAYRKVVFHEDIGWSVGYQSKATVSDGKKAAADGKVYPKGARLLSDFRPFEASIVVHGMNREARTMEVKAWAPLVGSYEERQHLVRLAVEGWAATEDPDGRWYVDLEGTWDDRCVATLVNFGDGEPSTRVTVEFPYAVGNEGVALGMAREVEVRATIVDAAKGDERTTTPMGEGRLAALRIETKEALVGDLTADDILDAIETKAGRVLSRRTETTLRGAATALADVLALVEPKPEPEVAEKDDEKPEGDADATDDTETPAVEPETPEGEGTPDANADGSGAKAFDPADFAAYLSLKQHG